MTRLLAVAALTLSIGACAGSRKGADAGGGAATTTGGTSSVASTVPAPTGTPAANTAGVAPSGGAKQGETCDDGKCAAGLQCISYYGIAGGAGPKFTSCEMRCDAITGKPRCPTGQNCVTIADGPGSVCRPSDM